MPRIRPCGDEERGAILEIVNAAAEAYRGVIPADQWREPYMPRSELDAEIAAGVVFWGYEADGELVGVMGVQSVGDVDLIRHAYVAPGNQGRGIGGALLEHLLREGTRQMLVGTWAAAEWAIRFYRRHGFEPVGAERSAALLKDYWTIPARQIETSVVLAGPSLSTDAAPDVHLVTPDLALIDAAIEGRPVVERALGCEVAEGWDVFRSSLARVRDAMAAEPSTTRWGTRLFVLDQPRTLVGWGGFKGAPRDGVVELGYAISPLWEGRGLATAAVSEMLREAFAAAEVRSVVAHTLAEPGPSARVLQKTGFVYDGDVAHPVLDTTWRFRIDRAGTPAPGR